MDHEDDKTNFEIAIINKRNMALVLDCQTQDGQITFGKIQLSSDNGLEYAKSSWYERQKQKRYHGPTFTHMSEPVQNSIMEYLYECGLRPEIAIAVEYLSWNKEQRLYMAWLRDLFLYIAQDHNKLE